MLVRKAQETAGVTWMGNHHSGPSLPRVLPWSQEDYPHVLSDMHLCCCWSWKRMDPPALPPASLFKMAAPIHQLVVGTSQPTPAVERPGKGQNRQEGLSQTSSEDCAGWQWKALIYTLLELGPSSLRHLYGGQARSCPILAWQKTEKN